MGKKIREFTIPPIIRARYSIQRNLIPDHEIGWCTNILGEGTVGAIVVVTAMYEAADFLVNTKLCCCLFVDSDNGSDEVVPHDCSWTRERSAHFVIIWIQRNH